MATLLSRFPFDTSIFNPKSRLSKFQEYWCAPEPTTKSTSDAPVPTITPIAPLAATTTPSSPSTQQVPQSKLSVPQSTGSVPPASDLDSVDMEQEFDFQHPSTSTPVQAADIEADNATGD